MTTGAVSVVPGFAAWVQNFAWAPDGKTVFFSFISGTHSLGLYRLGEPAVETARATGLDQLTAFSFTVVAAG
jgi:hypothetical protein